MTTLNEATEKIYQTFLTDWGATTSVTFDNETFNPNANEAYVRVTVRHTAAVQDSLGSVGRRKFDRIGTVFIQVFTPLDMGRQQADNLSTSARAVFEGKTLTPENLRFNAVITRELGVSDNWYQTNVEAPFNYTETK